MEFVNVSYEIMNEIDRKEILKKIEIAGRVCYKSEDKITNESASKFVLGLVKSGHHSVIEHIHITVKFNFGIDLSRCVTRHRLCNFSSESTMYCNYKSKGIKYIDMRHHFKNPDSITIWLNTLKTIEKAYLDMIALGELPRIARVVLPLCLKTELIVTSNLRQWRTIFEQRTGLPAHPQMREIMIPLLNEFSQELPEIYSDIKF
jgi:thymidylate synthase (FAD)